MKILGIDGCPKGWIGILIRENCEWDYLVSDSLEEIQNKFNPDYCFIDIPIVLSENNASRICDMNLRKLLPTNYRSSVFNPPVRSAIEASSYKEACEINKILTGKKISLQTWHIMPKISAVNDFLIDNTHLSSKYYESHPETFFFRLNGGIALVNKKKTQLGRIERLNILKRIHIKAEEIYKTILSETLRKDVAYDDILDAIVLSVAGINFFPDNFEMIPEEKIEAESGALQNVFIPKKLPHLR